MSSDQLKFFWGNVAACPVTSRDEQYADWLQRFASKNNLAHIVCLKQEHLSTGYVVDTQVLRATVSMFEYVGDFIITDAVNVGLVVLTADCLPIVLYDPIKKNIGIVHAGWKGASAGVVRNAVIAMQQQFATNFADIQVFFGAHARECCYQIQSDFFPYIQHGQDSVYIQQRNNNFYFNNAEYVKNQLCTLGLKSENIVTNTSCTMCDERYYSWRRDKSNGHAVPRGQASIVWMQF